MKCVYQKTHKISLISSVILMMKCIIAYVKTVHVDFYCTKFSYSIKL